MNISYKWLKDYLKFDLTPDETAAALTSIGLETEGVEEVESVRGGLKGLVVGQVLTCEPHPNSDHMHVTTVDLGHGETTQIVCGAPNVAAGQKVIVATLGTTLYDGDKPFVIKKAKLRGIPSDGMICAEDEIGVGNDHSGIIVLPEDTPVGMPAAEYYHLESDYTIAVDITPNRVDAASHYGVARDLNAYLGAHDLPHELTRPSVDDFDRLLEADKLIASKVSIPCQPIRLRLEQPDACPRYSGITIAGVTVSESPDWLKTRLHAIGLRAINNIVDITNFILFETGVPMHTFDADKIRGGQVVIKTCPEGTPFVTLDGNTHTLSERDLMICNAEAPMCIAGVFGGLESGTTTATQNVFLECACFHPTWVRKTARRQGLSTDASFRYERGVDIESIPYALRRAVLLVKELAGGTIVGDIVEEYPVKNQRAVVQLTYQRINSLSGITIPVQKVKEILALLEMEILGETPEGLRIAIPAYRVDVTRDCDVIEDILRIYGYDRVEAPDTIHSAAVTKSATDRANQLQQIISEQLTGAGMNEILCNSLSAEAYYDGLTTWPAERLVHVMNPLSSDLCIMRQTLLFGGLQSISRNINHRMTDCSFYEFGNVSFYDAAKQAVINNQVASGEKTALEVQKEGRALAGYSEEARLSLWLTGMRSQGSWAVVDTPATIYDLKAKVMGIFQRLGIQAGLREKQFQSDVYAAGLEWQTAKGRTLGTMGILTAALTHKFDIEQEVYYAELNWNALMKEAARVKVEQSEIAKFPPVRRDLALLVDQNVQFADIERAAFEADRRLLRAVSLFDVYEGKNLPEGKKSYAISLVLQDNEKTLSDKAIEAVMDKISKNIFNKVGATQR